MSRYPGGRRETSDGWPPLGQAWLLVLVLALANAFSFADRFLLTLLAQPIKESMQLSDTQIGLMQGTAFGLFYALMGLPLAWLSDRTVRRNVIAVGSALWSAMTVCTGFVSGYSGFLLTRSAVAVGEATLSPAGFSLLSDSFPSSRLALPTGVFASGVAVGTGAALLGGGRLFQYFVETGGMTLPYLGHREPWQCDFIVTGLAGLILLPLLALVREPKRRESNQKIDDTKSGSIGELFHLLGSQRGALVPIILGYAIATFASSGVAGWTPALLVRSYSMSISEVGLTLGIAFLIGGISGSLAGGGLADVLEQRGVAGAKLAVVSGSIALQFVPNILGPLSGSPTFTIVCYGLSVFLGQVAAAPTAAALQLMTPNRLRAKVNAVYFFVLNIVGIGMGPLAVALLSDHIFPGPRGLGYSISAVAALGGPIALILMLHGYRQLRQRQLAITSLALLSTPIAQ